MMFPGVGLDELVADSLAWHLTSEISVIGNKVFAVRVERNAGLESWA